MLALDRAGTVIAVADAAGSVWLLTPAGAGDTRPA